VRIVVDGVEQDEGSIRLVDDREPHTAEWLGASRWSA